MNIGSWIGQYLVAAAVFVLLDLVWLGFVANDLYKKILGDLVADKPNPAAAVAFYAIFLFGLLYFVIHPAIDEGSFTKAIVNGALFGLITYATWDLTNLAVIEGFPAKIVPIDMAWGTVLASGVSAGTYQLWRLFT